MRTTGYWVLGTSNHQMLRTKNNMQAALDEVAEWSKANGFKISQEITKAMHIMPYTIKTGKPSRPYSTLEWTNIGGSQHTQNTEAYTGQTIN
jgi:hypothetical protein